MFPTQHTLSCPLSTTEIVWSFRCSLMTSFCARTSVYLWHFPLWDNRLQFSQSSKLRWAITCVVCFLIGYSVLVHKSIVITWQEKDEWTDLWCLESLTNSVEPHYVLWTWVYLLHTHKAGFFPEKSIQLGESLWRQQCRPNSHRMERGKESPLKTPRRTAALNFVLSFLTSISLFCQLLQKTRRNSNQEGDGRQVSLLTYWSQMLGLSAF